MRILVSYYSRTGNTKKMAELIAKGIREVGVDCDVKDNSQVKIDELLNYEGLIFGSPTYYGAMAAEMKKLIDDSVKHHGKLTGKIGGAFSSSGMLGGGGETTILSILQAFMVHGMIIVGLPYAFDGQMGVEEVKGGSPYGASTIAGAAGERMPSDIELAGARYQGRHVAEIAAKLY